MEENNRVATLRWKSRNRIRRKYKYKTLQNQNQIRFSPNRLTEVFFENSFHIIKYMSYSKSVLAGPDLSKSKSTISGLPCGDL